MKLPEAFSCGSGRTKLSSIIFTGLYFVCSRSPCCSVLAPLSASQHIQAPGNGRSKWIHLLVLALQSETPPLPGVCFHGSVCRGHALGACR